MSPRPFCQISADESAAALAACLHLELPTMFVRYGDGALECMNGLGRGLTCDGEVYSRALGQALFEAWEKILTLRIGSSSRLYIGDWLTASFAGDHSTAYEMQYRRLVALPDRVHPPRFLHFETLLTMRRSPQLLDFYRSVKHDGRRKLIMGPEANAPAGELLGAEYFSVPMNNLFSRVREIEEALEHCRFDVLLWGAGMASAIPVANLFVRYPERTYINVGSAFDPFFRGRSRSQQIGRLEAGLFLEEIRKC